MDIINNNVVQTIMEMLHDRKYTLLDDSDGISAIRNNRVLKVFFLQGTKIGIKNINNIIETLQTKEIKDAIVVYTGNISSFAKQLLEENSETFNIELFHEDELVFNITHHNLVPKHEIVDDSVKKEIMKNFKITEKQIPYIFTKDPICKYYKGVHGNLFKITRNDSSVYYRLCVKK